MVQAGDSRPRPWKDSSLETVQTPPLGSLGKFEAPPHSSTPHGIRGCLYVLDTPPLMRTPQTSGYSRFFTDLLYLVRMPLGFFTFSSPEESVTLSPDFLALYSPSEISVFDAKPPIFEVVTLYLSQLFFCKRPSDRALTPHT